MDKPESVYQRTERLCDQWCDAWGAVVLERLVSGDPSAIPKGEWGPTGSRGKPGDMPGILDAFFDVEDVLASYQGPAMRRLLGFLHCDSVDVKTLALRFWFDDGTFVDLSQQDAEKHPPKVPVSYIEALTKRTMEPNWNRFGTPIPAQGGTSTFFADLAAFDVLPGDFYWWQYGEFRSKLIRRKGLKGMAIEMLERENRIKNPKQFRTIPA